MRRLLYLIALALLLLALPKPASAQSDPTVTILRIDQDQQAGLHVDIALDKVAHADAACTRLKVMVGDAPVAPSSCTVSTQPGAVAIVADLSAAMSQTDGGSRTRFDSAQPWVERLVNQLAATPNQLVSLTVFTDTVAMPHTLTDNLGGVQNTLRTAFKPRPLEAEQAAYPLAAAIDQGLDQLSTAPADRARTLVVVASGDPLHPLDAVARSTLATHAARVPNLDMLILAAGQTPVGILQRHPADPEGLRMFADALGGDLAPIALQGDLLPVAQRDALVDKLAVIAQRSAKLTLTLDTATLTPGGSTLHVALDTASDASPLTIVGSAATAHVVVRQEPLAGVYTLSIAGVPAEQIALVHYLLDDRVLAQPLATQPYSLELDTNDAMFQRRFPPGEHELVAAIVDRNGEERRTDAVPLRVATPVPGLRDLLWRWWWTLPLTLLLLSGWLVALWPSRRARRKARHSPAVADDLTDAYTQGASDNTYAQADDLTAEQGGVRASQFAAADDLRTHDQPQGVVAQRGASAPAISYRAAQHYNDSSPIDPADHTAPVAVAPRVANEGSGTQPFTGIAALPRAGWTVEVLHGAPAERVTLQLGSREHALGRKKGGHPLAVAIDSPFVSALHARLCILHDGLQLTPFDTTNGTFVGEGRQLLARGEQVVLASGDVFWLSEHVKLRALSEE